MASWESEKKLSTPSSRVGCGLALGSQSCLTFLEVYSLCHEGNNIFHVKDVSSIHKQILVLTAKDAKYTIRRELTAPTDLAERLPKEREYSNKISKGLSAC